MGSKYSILVIALAVSSSAPAWGICRVVQEEGSPPPVIAPEQSVLLIKHDDVVIRSECGGTDAGSQDGGLTDASVGLDDAGLGGNTFDASPVSLLDGGQGPSLDAGNVDAGDPPICEEIRGEAITMIVQPEFTLGADGSRFALLMVTPSWPLVAVADRDILHDLAVATSPEVLVYESYIEDASLGYQCSDPKWNAQGCGGGAWSSSGSDWRPPNSDPFPSGDPPQIPEIQTIGAYEVARLNVGNTLELADWLGSFDYLYTDADLAATEPYIDMGWTIVAVRVRHDFGHHGGITPLSFSWAGSELRLPTGISVAPPPSESHLTVYVSAEQRYDFPQSNIPYAQPAGFGGGSFLTRNDMWVDLSLGADSDPIAFASSGLERESVSVERVVRIPSSRCPQRESESESDDGCGCNVRGVPGVGSLLLLLVCVFGLRRRRSP